MTRKDLSKILKVQIPLSKAMGLKVISVSAKSGVSLLLPLKPNRNHKGTAFGGTLVAAQALASWAFIMALLSERSVAAEVVVQRQASEFLRPVDQNFTVSTQAVAAKSVERFFNTLERHGKARIEILAEVQCGGKKAASFNGAYVAILHRRGKV